MGDTEISLSVVKKKEKKRIKPEKLGENKKI